MTGKKELLQPLEQDHVKLYVCGITSYDYCHVGHARSALVFDMIVRYLRYRGFRVTFVRNFTDIDDKIINRANEKGVSADKLANQFIDEFYTDMDKLEVLRPDIEPRATEHIDEMIVLVTELIDKGLAYQSGADVYFRVDKFVDYGALSGRSLEDMQAGARIEINEQKQHPMDFVLWKGSKPGEPKWKSPWGEGRPGWHIECSAMSRKYLKDTFDIHGGGKDLIFPHHENEIAQSEGATGKRFANLWIHHGFVTIRDEKMSKSLGNFLTIREVLETCSPEVLRLFIFSTQYRNPLDFSRSALQDAQVGLERIYDCLNRLSACAGVEIKTGSSIVSDKDRQKIETLQQRFEAAMDSDFNTAKGLGLLFDAVKVLNKIMRMLPVSPVEDDVCLLVGAKETFKRLGAVIGLFQEDPVLYIANRKKLRLAAVDLDELEIEDLIDKRNQARLNKDWAQSDAIRDKLLSHNVEIHDGLDGTYWDART